MAIVDFVVKNGLVVTEEAQILGTTDATSSSDTAASLYSAGGAAIAKKAYVGTDLSVGNNGSFSGTLTVGGGSGTIGTDQTTFNLLNTVATTINFGGAATSMEIGAATGTTNINNNLDVDGDVNIDGGDLTVSTATFNLANANATTLNVGGAATTTNLGAAAAVLNLGTTAGNSVLEVRGNATTGTATVQTNSGVTTANVFNTHATTGNLFGAATAVNVGAGTGTVTVNNPTITHSGSTATLSTVVITGTAGQFSCATNVLRIGDSVAITGTFGGTGSITGYTSGNVYFIIATNGTTTFTLSATPNGSAITTTAGTPTGLTYTLTRSVVFNMNSPTPTIASNNNGAASVFNTNILTGNLFGAATSINIGATTGTTTINNPTVVGSQTSQNLYNTVATTMNFAGAATTVNIGAATGTLTIGNQTITGTNATTLNLNGASPSIVTSSTATASVFNTNATTGNLFGAATTATLGYSGTAASTTNISTGAVAASTVKTVNIGTGGAASSTTNVNIGSTAGGTTTINSGTVVGGLATQNVFNTIATTVNAFGAATAITIGSTTGTLTTRNPAIVGTETTQSVYNTVATTVNAFGAATAIEIGAATGTTSINNSLSVDGNTTLGDAAADTLTINGTAVSIPNNLNFDSNTFFIDATNNRVGVNTNGPGVSFHNVGAGILSNNTTIDPDSYANTVIAGAIADGSGWGVTSAIGGNAGTGDSWAIGHNGNFLYMAVGDATSNDTFSTYIQAGGATRRLLLAPSTSAWNVGIGYTDAATLGAKLDITANTPASDTALRIKSNVAYLSPDGNQTITSRMLNTDILSFSGSTGQLFSLADTMTGTIFSVNDVSGMPSIEVYDSGQVRIAELTGNVLIGTATDSAANKLQVVGNTYISGSLGVGTTSQGRKVTISRATETTAEQLELRVEGGISNGNYDGIVFTQGAAGATTLSSIRCNYNSTGQPDMSFNLRSESNVLFLRNGGNVGVNTNAPDRKFVVAGTGADGTEVTKVTSTGNINNGQYHWMTSVLAPNEANAHIINIVGNALSSKNSGYFGFRYQGAGSNSNYVTIGGYGVDNIITATMAGNAGVGTNNPQAKLHVAGSIYAYAPDNSTINFSNADSDSATFTNRGDRVLTSNGTNWVADGKDPILTLTRNNAGTTRGQSIGLLLHNENGTTNSYSPLIGFSALSNSGSYNSLYAAIMGKKTGANAGVDSNWNKGELHFYAVGDAYIADVPNMVITGTSVGVGVSSPVSKLQSSGAAQTASPTGGSAAGTGLYITNTDTSYGMMFGVAASGNGWIQQQRSDGGNTQYNITLNPIGGSVGVGTSPSEKFHVSGTVRIDGTTDGLRIFKGGADSINSAVYIANAANNRAYNFQQNAAGDALALWTYGGSSWENRFGFSAAGLFTAVTKSFKIDHPTKAGMKLQYACLEGPENGVYVRGSLKNSNVIELPEYWTGLVDPDSITVSITPRGRRQDIYVGEIKDNRVNVIGEDIDCFYVIYGERKDVDKLLVEIGDQ